MRNKKIKWAIPAAVLALSCGSIAALTGCEDGGGEEPPPEPHTHSYTQWVNTDPDEHWKICPEDGAIDETTRDDHDFDADGNCECGATGEVAVYGTVRGEVKLNKQGNNITEFTGLRVELDGDVEIATSTAGGKFTYSISNVEVGKAYTLTISKVGYKTYETTVELETENQEVVIGGAAGITLDYEVFGLMIGWNKNHHDFTHANDAENPYILFGENEGNETLNVLSSDSYEGAVTASMKIKYGNSDFYMHTQGIVLKFADGKHLIVRYHNGDVANGKIQYCNSVWGDEANGFAPANTLFGEAAQNATQNEGDPWRWGEHAIHDLTDKEWTKIKTGADLTCILKDGGLYTFFDGKFIDKVELPSGYTDKDVQVGYFAFNAVSGARFDYGMSGEVPTAFTSVVGAAVDQPEFADAASECLVDIAPAAAEGNAYAFGTEVTANITVGADRKLQSFTVDGEDYFEDALDGSVTFTASRLTHSIAASFIAAEEIDVDLTVKGKKDGAATALNAAEVTLSGITDPFTADANGKIAGKVNKGKYIVSVDGYLPKEIEIDGTAQEITLEYEKFVSVSAADKAGVDLTQMNEQNGKITAVGNSKNVNVASTESYTDVTATATFDVINDYANKQRRYGIYLLFGDNKNLRVDLDLHENGENYVLQETNWDTMQGFNWGWAKTYSADDVAGFVANGFTYTLVRNGEKVHIIANGELIKSYTLPNDYKTQPAKVGFIMDGNTSDGTKGFTYDIAIEGKAVTVTNGTEDENGTVAITENVKLGDTVTVTLTPNAEYKIGSLTVGGKDVTESIMNGSYTFTAAGDTTVVATFAPIVYSEINAEVVGNKLGVTSNAITGTETVTLTSTSVSDITATLTKSGDTFTVSATHIPTGEYTVHISGYLPTTITVGETAYAETITVEYDLMENLTPAWGWGDKANLAEQNDGKLTQEQGATQWVSSKNSYDSVAITATVVSGGTRQGVFIRFKGDNYVNDKYAMIQKQSNDKISWNGETNLWGNGSNLFGDNWTDYENPLIQAPDSYTLTLVRDGANIHVFVNGMYYETKTLDASYANQECYVGVYCTDIPSGAVRTFKIEEDVSKFLTCAVPNETADDAHGIVTLDKASNGYTLGDTVNVTITPDAGYKLAKLEVGGNDVTPKTWGGESYSFLAGGTTPVKATFEEIVESSINAEIVGKKLGTTNGLTGSETVTLKSHTVADITNATLSVSEDKILLSATDIPAGEYYVVIDGYFRTTITVGATEYTEKITLQYDELSLIQGWGSMSYVINSDGSANVTATNESETVISKSTFGNIAVTLPLASGEMMKKDGESKGEQFIVFRFEDNKSACLRIQGRQKIQFTYSEWFTGESADGSNWQDLISFTEGDKYLTALDQGKLEMTAVRKGAAIYAILTVDGVSEVIGCRTFDGKYADDAVKVGFAWRETVNGSVKTWNNFRVSDADKMLEQATRLVGEDKRSYLGTWTEADGKLAVSGKGMIMFDKVAEGIVKESVSINIAAANATNEQYLYYAFADGKWVAVRYQKVDENSGKVQFTCDTVLFKEGYLVGWGYDYAMTTEEFAAFNSDGIKLTFIRDGNNISVYLGSRKLGEQTLDAAYATAKGNIGIMIDGGNDSAFAYEHQFGDNVTVPTESESVTPPAGGEEVTPEA